MKIKEGDKLLIQTHRAPSLYIVICEKEPGGAHIYRCITKDGAFYDYHSYWGSMDHFDVLTKLPDDCSEYLKDIAKLYPEYFI